MKGKQFFSNKIYLGKSQEERVTGDTKILLAIGPRTRARTLADERTFNACCIRLESKMTNGTVQDKENLYFAIRIEFRFGYCTRIYYIIN